MLYAVAPEVTALCAAATKGREIALVKVRHLQAACAMLKDASATMVIVSTTVKWWDRDVIEDLARQACVPVRYVAEGYDDQLGRDVLAAVETARVRRLALTGKLPTRASAARSLR